MSATLLEVWKNMCTSAENYETCRDDLILDITVFELEFCSLPVTDIHTNSAPFGRDLMTSLPTPQGKTSSAPIHICISTSLMGKCFCFKCFSFKLVATSFQLPHWISYMKSLAHVHFYICMRGLLTEKSLTLRVFEGSWNSPHWVPLGFLWLEVRTRTNPALPFG